MKQSVVDSFGFRHVVCFNGMMVNRLIGDYYNIPSNDIDTTCGIWSQFWIAAPIRWQWTSPLADGQVG